MRANRLRRTQGVYLARRSRRDTLPTINVAPEVARPEPANFAPELAGE